MITPVTAVTLANTSVSYMDVQAGMNYAYFPQENVYINAGYSIQHVNRPKETFLTIIPTRAAYPCAILVFECIAKSKRQGYNKPECLFYHTGKGD